MTQEHLFEPDAEAAGSWTDDGYRIAASDISFTTAEAHARGFAAADPSQLSDDWVQANAFQVRGLIRRGDAQRFDITELREVVRRYLTSHGVEIEHPDVFEAFCFNYMPHINLDEAREEASRQERELT